MSRTAAARYLPGTVLAGRYEVRGLLAGGGMAEVYVGADRLLGRDVAIKVIRDHLASDRQFVARFRREARAAASLGHPGIVAVHDVGIHDGMPFMVMELVAGETLGEVLSRQGPLPAHRVVQIGREIAEALAAAHAAGIIHRDVKPGNVMLTPSGRVKVLDFGIARALAWTPVTDTATPHGTAEYMSPETVMGEPAGGRSDVYSLGAVLYEMAAGRPPFVADNRLAIAYQHVEQGPVPLERLRPDLDRSLGAVVMRCLQKHPADRPSAAELAGDLGRLAAGSPVSTSPMPVLSPTRPLPYAPPRPRPRRRWRPALVVAAVVAAVIVPTVMVVTELERRSDRPARRPLRPPSALTAAAGCAGLLRSEVRLAWEPTRSRFADGYEVFRGTDAAGPYDRIAVVPGRETTSYVDDDVSGGTRYVYVVKATARARTSAVSEQAEARTPFACLF